MHEGRQPLGLSQLTLAQRPERSHERLLGQVAGRVAVAGPDGHHRLDPPIETVHQLRFRLGVAGGDAFDQARIALRLGDAVGWLLEGRRGRLTPLSAEQVSALAA
jgi:hypothetical protein